MISDEVLQKIWGVQSENNEGGRVVKKRGGGICVAGYGLIVTHLKDIYPTNLCGQFYGSNEWHDLKIRYRNDYYNLALLEVVSKNDQEIAFSYFDVGVNVDEHEFHRMQGGDIVLERGELLHCVDHLGFKSRIGYLSRRVEGICEREPETGVSEVSLEDINRAENDFYEFEPEFCLYVKHILSAKDKVPLRMMGNTPVIQASGLGFNAALGSPVFDDNDNLIGLYYLYHGHYSYIIPIGVLYHFMSLMPTPAGSQGYEGVKNMLSGRMPEQDP